ncbi:vWA domain-containing protein [Clostridium tunisiense]|uniref:vWA domain-containing protein n=1 Tax=Clostridium tunisiense TaxID=219748 RepID=UPI0002FFF1C8|nr:VWA-like domain-containing protein [Clostridium tunisiense]
MGNKFHELKEELYEVISNVQSVEAIPRDFEEKFLSLINKVNFLLMEDKDNFYGYFLLQMGRAVKYDIASPTSIEFKQAKYVIYFNPFIYLGLTTEQMQSTIKHEIHHILSLHLIRAKQLKHTYSTLAINMAMDIVVNQYLDYLPPYATTIEWVNLNYNLNLKPYNSMEYYVNKIQEELNLLEENEDSEEDDTKESDIEKEYDISKTHNQWDKSLEIDDKTLKEFTEKFASEAVKGTIPVYLSSMIEALSNEKGEIPWNIYLKKLMGTLESKKKKTITRRNRRQPNRLDLKGELRNHIAKVTVAIDISGSISDEEFHQAMKEVLSIVKNYNHEITILECDTEIRRSYKIKSIKDIKEREVTGGGTKFSPVFQYVNGTDTNILIYFTDGKGEERLKALPKAYNTLWIISGRGDKLSLANPFGIVKRLKKVEIRTDTVDLLDIKNEGWSMNSQQPMI